MRGHVRRPAAQKTWQAIYELGEQTVQRCQSCNKRFWVERRRHEACPVCGGELKDRLERRQGCRSGFRTKKEAEEALNDILGSLRYGTYIEPSKATLREFLLNEWLPAIESTVRPTTYVGYECHVNVHLVPGLGSTPLQKLTPSAINGLYAKLLTEPRMSRKKPREGEEDREPLKPLSRGSVRRIHATLHRALRDAVRWGKLHRNPCDAADPPAARVTEDNEMRTWTAKEVRRFLAKTRGDRLHPLWRTLAATGVRRGEALGLRWEDVDLKARLLMVRQALVPAGYEVRVSEPKTKRGRRTIPLDAETVAVLKEWRREQRKEKLRWGKLWTDTGLVFTREDGTAWHPGRISKLFDTEVRKSGLPRIRLHDLRHTHATLALAAGVHPKAVADRLGHSTVALTLDVYSHWVPSVAEDAAERIAGLFTTSRGAPAGPQEGRRAPRTLS